MKGLRKWRNDDLRPPSGTVGQHNFSKSNIANGFLHCAKAVFVFLLTAVAFIYKYFLYFPKFMFTYV